MREWRVTMGTNTQPPLDRKGCDPSEQTEWARAQASRASLTERGSAQESGEFILNQF